MTLKDDLKAYQARWAEVDRIVAQERRSAPIELRWRQLNAAYAMAIHLGLHQADASETGVFERWAKIKERTAGQLPKV